VAASTLSGRSAGRSFDAYSESPDEGKPSVAGPMNGVIEIWPPSLPPGPDEGGGMGTTLLSVASNSGESASPARL
jgi:hypothetical protein